MITLDNLTKIFDTDRGVVSAADHINMEVPQGEICVLLGPSGCGKTTTLKMVNRIITPTSGRVLINGKDTSEQDTVSLRRSIGYVIQQIGLFPNMTIEENISIVPKLIGWDKSRYLKRASELLEMVAMDPAIFLKRYPNELSGGQQQRIGVIRALAADPPVMLMDEPFGAIDPINREVIQDEFLKLHRELKKTVMFVSHDIDEAVKMADRIAIFKEGKLIQYDTPDDILSHPINDFVKGFVGRDRALKRLQLVTVAEVLETESSVVTAEDSLATALQRMTDAGYERAIIVVDGDGRPVGYVSRSVATTTKGNCGQHSYNLRTLVRPEDDLRTVASKMFTHDATWLPCVSEHGKLMGVVTQRGITHHLGATYKSSHAKEQNLQHARVAP
ncbi:ABC transporter ATP-binding protein [Marinobacter orientalis]|uniref:Quaternary amine transport ATP-binding protein n=1 Tax=Marinobacter orientalis TaxID=1928859 RepID=A0A7Y0REK4_9GAMM|nr:ABC transporter ATP-binding protein [Marinobacter orientalis]NMT64775.1 ABC transporter ATP-binding protein [Marinobacter orientalis]TGX48766.1 ATP-binding cassette domain-containing protein [Marinobacter orientalis]